MLINEILIPFLLKESAEMLDISIKNADKAVLTNKKIDPAKAKALLNQNYIVQEKADGTKLTLYRNDQPFDPNDYTKNWVVSYKNAILWPEEFGGLDRAEIKKSSIGYTQYAFVHDHLKSVQGQLGKIPNNMEFFIEFIQNKPTTTRDYERYNDLWLIAYSPAEGQISGGYLRTRPEGFFQENNDEYAKILGLGQPPVVFQGNPSTKESFRAGIKSKELQASFAKHEAEFDSDPYTAVKNSFLDMASVLGGKPEGVVLKNEKTGEYYKFIQSDQHDKEVRFAKKLRYKGSEEEENTYFARVKEVANQLIAQSKAADVKTKLKEIAALVQQLPPDTITHPKKDWFKVREDIMVTVRINVLGNAEKNRAVYFGRFQPLTNAHAAIIKQALEIDKNVHLYLVVVTGEQSDPIDNPFNINLQKKMIASLGYGDKLSLTQSRTGSLGGKEGILTTLNDPAIGTIYCGPDRAEGYKNQLNPESGIQVKVVPEIKDIRATKVRDVLRNEPKGKERPRTPQQQQAEYNSLVPPGMHPLYNELKQVIDRQKSAPQTDQPSV